MDIEKLREALQHRNVKANKKYLLQVADELREQDRETYDSILKCRTWTGELKKASKRCRLASAVSVVSFVLAFLLVAASYILGDFGMAIFTGWLNRYLMAIGVVAGICLVGLGVWLSSRQKALLIALALIEDENQTAAE